MRRRLLVPYLVPGLVILISIFFSQYTSSVCQSLNSIALLALIAFLIGLYGFTVLRFFYLRYLYLILENATDRQMLVHKVLSSTTFGIIGSLLAATLHACIWILISASFIYTNPYLSQTYNYIIVMYVVQIIVFTFVGIVISITDVVIHWKTIVQNGFLHFLTFEDPFHLRSDMVSIAGVLICLNVITIKTALSDQEYGDDLVVGYFKMMACVCTYQLAGFTAIIFEWLHWIRSKFNKKRDQKHSEQRPKDLEDLLKRDSSFHTMFKSYCEKEFSLENLLLFDTLMRLKNPSHSKSAMTKEEFDQFYQTFFKPFSKFEVNMPSKVKKDLDDISKRDQDVKISELEDILHTDMLLNLRDTFERLKDTKQYKRWSFSREIQTEQSVV